MPEFHSLQRAIQAFVAFVFVLAVIVAMLMMRNVSINTTIPDLSVVKPVEFKPSVDADALNLITERPLFWSERRPFEPPQEKVVEKVVEVEDDALEGVELIGVLASSQGSTAIFKRKKEKFRMSLSDELEGWVLEDIEPGIAVFTMRASAEADPEFTIIELRRREVLPSVWQSEPKDLSEK